MASTRYLLPTPATSELALAPHWPNSHLTGQALKEYLRRAFYEILAGAQNFKASNKPGSAYRPRDQVTDIDHKVQLLLLRWLMEAFPGTGIIAEEVVKLQQLQRRFSDRDLTSQAERYLHLPCVIPGLEGVEFFLVFDPIDGTGAYIRGDIHGVASQIALVARANGRVYVLSAFIIDALTQEIFGYRPGSSRVHRITRFERSRLLNGRVGRQPLTDGLVILRDASELHTDIVQRMVRTPAAGGLFRTQKIETGSIALSYASLWCSGAAFIVAPFPDTPWDMAPPLGINRRLGYLPFAIIGESVMPYDYKIPMETLDREFEVIWVHRLQAPMLYSWCDANHIQFMTWEERFPGRRPR